MSQSSMINNGIFPEIDKEIGTVLRVFIDKELKE